MELKEAIMTRRSIRQYQDRPVSRMDLEEILDAGTYAPSAADLQPWYFVAIQDKEQIARLAPIMRKVAKKATSELEDRFPNHPKVVEETTQFIRSLGNAPVCILAFQLKSDYRHAESSIIQSVSAAIENMLLAAVDKGMGGCWMNAPLKAGAWATLQEYFAPDKGRLVAMLTIGYPEKIPQAPARKEGRYIII